MQCSTHRCTLLQELLYNIEFQVQQMERKVNRAKGINNVAMRRVFDLKCMC